jgi:hypothetical protein
MAVEMDNFWWEDGSCLAPDVYNNTVAAICQYDIAVALTTTTGAASTTTRIPESTTITVATTEVFTTTTVTTTVTPGTSCRSGWQEFEGHCYLLVKVVGVTWAGAEKDCKDKGGHLTSIHSDAESSFIHSLYSSYLLIGGTDAAVEVDFPI